jgi:transposase
MYIEKIPNRNSPPCILVRESYRQEGKVHKRTLANISHLSDEVIDGIGKLLKGGYIIEDSRDDFRIIRSLPHGHVFSILSVINDIGLKPIIASRQSKELKLVIAMIVSRIVNPGSKLATARSMSSETCSTTLGILLGIERVSETDFYHAMDWLVKRQDNIESSLARKHLEDGSLVLYDVSSSYFEGVCCPLARRGHNRDKKQGKLQIVYGLLCDKNGCPVAIEVFEGNTADPKTVKGQIVKLRNRFGLKRVIIVGDRGMLTSARIREELQPEEGLDWISALKAPSIRKIMEDKQIDRSLFDRRDLAEITHPDFPGERLIVCYNPLLEQKRKKTRLELLAVTEKHLGKITNAISRKRNPLRGMEKIGIAVGKVINKYKVGKHFQITITEDSLSCQRKAETIESESRLDGFYIIRTSVEEEILDADETVKAYKQLSLVEQAFRSLKTVDLKIRPIFHHLADRVKAHVFLCMLAYYVEWHIRKRLAQILFDDDDKENAQRQRQSPVKPAQPSRRARDKAASKRCEDDGQPVHSFQTLLDDLATITRNTVEINGERFDKITVPTVLQQKALKLLKVRL